MIVVITLLIMVVFPPSFSELLGMLLLTLFGQISRWVYVQKTIYCILRPTLRKCSVDSVSSLQDDHIILYNSHCEHMPSGI